MNLVYFTSLEGAKKKKQKNVSNEVPSASDYLPAKTYVRKCLIVFTS